MTHTDVLRVLRRWGAIGCLLAFGPLAHAAYSCSVTATHASLFSNWLSAQTTTGSATLTCTRASGDANTLSYRLKATTGLSGTGSQPYRRVRRAGSGSPLDYSLRRGSTCDDESDWLAPATGTTDVQTGTLSFGSALVASTSMAYCIRVPATWFSTSGVYTDTFEIFAQYPNSNAGALSPSAPVAVSVGVGEQCMFNTYPGSLVFNYTAFSASAQTASTSFVLRCSSGLPWSISVTPSPATLLGLQYAIAASPASGSGNGNTGQAVTLTGSMPAGQAGTCASPSCTDTQAHTVVITY